MLTKMLVAIRHKQGDPLASTLCMLQPQLAEQDDIYVIDTTTTREGWGIVKKYGTSRSVIFTEVGQYSEEQCSTFFKERAVRNDHRGILYLDNVLFSTTFIANLKRAAGSPRFDVVSPKVLENGEVLNANFKWHNPPTIKIFPSNDYTPRCVCMKIGGSGRIGIFPNEKVILL